MSEKLEYILVIKVREGREMVEKHFKRLIDFWQWFEDNISPQLPSFYAPTNGYTYKTNKNT